VGSSKSEWKHLTSESDTPKRSQDLLIIALAFLLYFPGLVLLWRFPFKSKAQKLRFRIIVISFFPVPVVWAFGYLLYRLILFVAIELKNRFF